MAIMSNMETGHGLSKTHPDLAKELVDASAADAVSAGSNRTVRWRCAQGHEWDARVSSRAVNGSGCPYCAGKLPIEGQTDLATTHPDLAKELVDSELAHVLKAGSNRKVSWKCAEGHEWEARVSARVAGNGCPYCSGRRKIEDEGDF